MVIEPPSHGTPLGGRKVLRYAATFFGVLALLGVGLVVFTDSTHFTADQVRGWLAAAAPAIGGLAALATASVAVVAIQAQQMSSQEALNAQGRASQAALTLQAASQSELLEHQRQLASDDRLWNQRIPLYSDLLMAVRDEGLGRRNPSGDFDEQEISDIATGMADAQRVVLGDLEPRVLLFASEAVRDLWSSHLGSCGWVQECSGQGGYLTEKEARDFFDSVAKLQIGVRAELVGRDPSTTAG